MQHARVAPGQQGRTKHRSPEPQAAFRGEPLSVGPDEDQDRDAKGCDPGGEPESPGFVTKEEVSEDAEPDRSGQCTPRPIDRQRPRLRGMDGLGRRAEWGLGRWQRVRPVVLQSTLHYKDHLRYPIGAPGESGFMACRVAGAND